MAAQNLATRRVEIGGIVHEPTGAWMMQVAKNLLDAEDGFLVDKTRLIMDLDPVFTSDFRALLSGAGLIRFGIASSPRLAIAERHPAGSSAGERSNESERGFA